MERDSGTVFVDQQFDVPDLDLAIVEPVVGSERVLVDDSQVGQVGEAPSGAGAKPPLDCAFARAARERVTLSPKLARLDERRGVVHDGGSQPVDSFVRLAESDELAYVHVERRVFSLGYEKGGAMQFAAGGYMASRGERFAARSESLCEALAARDGLRARCQSAFERRSQLGRGLR